MRWVKNPILGVVNNHGVDYPTPTNQTYFFGFGSLAGIMLIFQILTGIFLAMHYTGLVSSSFASVEHIMRDVNWGWFFRYMHANGASFFFMVVYFHIFRGIYYGSYIKPRHHLWLSGVLIFVLMMATGFLGYVLPWGQMSFWGATVITNLFSVIPFIGDALVAWLWGGFSVDDATLHRFYSFHYTLPFIIAGVSALHITLLHQAGSSNPAGVVNKCGSSNMPFFPYFYKKDLYNALGYFTIFLTFVFFYPNVLGHPDNYIPADPMVTPAHIVPEWYFLPFYAILRSIANKTGGVVAMGGSIAVIALLPFLHTSNVSGPLYRPLYQVFFWLFIVSFMILGWIGQQPVEYPFVEIGIGAMYFYFSFFLIIIPSLGFFEKNMLSSKSFYKK
jgi:ubiquinol-cytochrome c reductase cytochrome b subunit